MKHRHNGPPVRYRTSRGNVRFRKRPLHRLILSRKRAVRYSTFSDRERHADSLFKLQQEHKGLREEIIQVRGEMDDTARNSAVEEKVGSLLNTLSDKSEKEQQDDMDFSMSENDKKFEKLIEKENILFDKIEDKLKAIEEEREFLDEDE